MTTIRTKDLNWTKQELSDMYPAAHQHMCDDCMKNPDGKCHSIYKPGYVFACKHCNKMCQFKIMMTYDMFGKPISVDGCANQSGLHFDYGKEMHDFIGCYGDVAQMMCESCVQARSHQNNCTNSVTKHMNINLLHGNYLYCTTNKCPCMVRCVRCSNAYS